jgi:two-component system response regulator NreC
VPDPAIERLAETDGSARPILIADDHAGVCQALTALLERQRGWTVCGCALAASKAMRLLSACQPQLAVIDLKLGQDDGLALMREMRAVAPDIRLVVYSLLDEPETVERCRDAGAHGFVSKREPPGALLDAIESVFAGMTRFAPEKDGASRERSRER